MENAARITPEDNDEDSIGAAPEVVAHNIPSELAELKRSNEARREDVKTKDAQWYEKMCAEHGIRKLQRSEAQAYLTKKYGKLPWFLEPSPHFFVLEDNDEAFDIRVKPGVLDDALCREFHRVTVKAPLEALIPLFSRAAKKYQTFRKNKGGNHYKIEIDESLNFNTSMMGGYTIYMGGIFVNRLLRAILEQNYEVFKATEKSIESQYLHEFIHILNANDFENETVEELTLLAQFLYDPLMNREGNKLFNEYFGNSIFDEERLRKEDRWSEAYDTGYKHVTSKILLYELSLREEIIPPLSANDQKLVLANMSEYYAALSEEERDGIVRKYLPRSKDELYALGKRITEEMHLAY